MPCQGQCTHKQRKIGQSRVAKIQHRIIYDEEQITVTETVRYPNRSTMQEPKNMDLLLIRWY